METKFHKSRNKAYLVLKQHKGTFVIFSSAGLPINMEVKSLQQLNIPSRETKTDETDLCGEESSFVLL